MKQTLNKIINHVMTSEKEIDNFKDGFQSELITKNSNVSNKCIADKIFNIYLF